jgi:succinate dehydrogenase / fumarate reductase membrane anchor subunit
MRSMRSPLGRAAGLGSAKEGVENWWRERVAGIALTPLALWFVGSIIPHSGDTYAEFVSWLKAPFVTLMMVLLLVAMFYHMALGLQVIVEDYVHSAMKTPYLIVIRLGCVVFAVAGILSVLRIAFAG